MAKEKWVVMAKKADFEKMGKRFGISPYLARLIRNRDMITEKEVDYFLNATPADMHDPRQMHDMEKGAALLNTAIEEGRKIRIIGDYDVDGVCASYILKKGLETLGGDVSVIIPHRVNDGYGINKRLIDNAIEDSVEMIVTCDNGISAFEEIAYAVEKGIEVIVTDHHEVPYNLKNGKNIELIPPAAAVINPKQEKCDYPYKGICGALVAYKLIQTMFGNDTHEVLRELLEFAAIATVCDVMELVDENRIVVKTGLQYLSYSSNIGLRALIDVCDLSESEIGSYHIGFVIGPCMNATGRLDSAMEALKLFEAGSMREAYPLAVKLKEMNEARKKMTEESVEIAVSLVEENGWHKDDVIVVYLSECHESIAGIVAGRLRERYERPVFVLTDGEEGLKGSGRSIEAYSMYDGLCTVKDILVKFGGHKMAAGLSMKKENLGQFRERINQNTGLCEEDFIPKIKIDIALPLSYASIEFVNELKCLEPFGNGNPKPVFAVKNVRFSNLAIRGKNQNVASFVLEDVSGYHVNGIYFGDASEFITAVRANGNVASILYYPQMNEFRGNISLQIVVKSYMF